MSHEESHLNRGERTEIISKSAFSAPDNALRNLLNCYVIRVIIFVASLS